MSLKSREKSMQRQQEWQENIFAKQKAAAAIAKKWTADYLYAALFFAALTVLLAVLVKNDPEDLRNFWCTAPLLAAVILWFLLGFLRRFCFLHTMEKVPFSGTEERTLVCARVRVVACPVSRFTNEIVGFVLIAQDRKKYRYILPQAEVDSRETRQRWKRAYVGQKLLCTCYSGTANIESVVLLERSMS